MTWLVDAAPTITSIAALCQVGTVRRWPVVGFTIGLAVQPVWVAYSVSTDQPGFLIATVAFVFVNAWQLRKALLSRRSVPVTADPAHFSYSSHGFGDGNWHAVWEHEDARRAAVFVPPTGGGTGGVGWRGVD